MNSAPTVYNPASETESIPSGTTGDNYVAVAALYNGYGAEWEITNTHATASLTYKVERYVTDDVLEAAVSVTTDTPIPGAGSPAAVVNKDCTDPFYKCVVSVKSTVGSTPATFRIFGRKY